MALYHNGSYNDTVTSIMESRDLSCDSSDSITSYMMNGRGKIHPPFINNDRHVEFYMLVVVPYGWRPILRINVVERPRKEASTSPPPLSLDDNSMKHEDRGNHLMDMDMSNRSGN